MLEHTWCTCSCTFFCFFLGANIWSYSSVYSRSHLLGFLRRFFSDRTAKREDSSSSSVLTKKLEENPVFSGSHLCTPKGTEMGTSKLLWLKLWETKNDLLWFITCKSWEGGDFCCSINIYTKTHTHTYSASNLTEKIKLTLVSYSDRYS